MKRIYSQQESTRKLIYQRLKQMASKDRQTLLVCEYHVIFGLANGHLKKFTETESELVTMKQIIDQYQR